MKIESVSTYPDGNKKLGSKEANIVVLESSSPNYNYDYDESEPEFYGERTIWSHVMFREDDIEAATAITTGLAAHGASEVFGDSRKLQQRCFIVYEPEEVILDALEAFVSANKREVSPI